MIRRSDIDINELITRINSDSFFERTALFVWGVLIYAISFSVFFSTNNIVTGGSTGLSLLIHEIFQIDTSLFVFLFSLVFLVIGYITLGKEETIKTICGVILLPIFMKFSIIFPYIIELKEASLFLNVFFGGVLMGLGNGIILRSGFSCGGFQTIYQILYKYYGISVGKSTLIINGVLIVASAFFFDITNALYAIIGLYVGSIVTDKVMLETSITKTFFIVTHKDKEINQYIIENLGRGATILKARGGYDNDKKKVLMCAVPTREYYRAKEIIENIDPNAFFLILDTYEIYGGV